MVLSYYISAYDICRYNVDYDTVNVVIFRFVIDIEIDMILVMIDMYRDIVDMYGSVIVIDIWISYSVIDMVICDVVMYSYMLIE